VCKRGKESATGGRESAKYRTATMEERTAFYNG